MNEQPLPKELWRIILAQLNFQDRLVFLFTIVGQEKSIGMNTNPVYFMDFEDPNDQTLSTSESRRIIGKRLQTYINNQVDMDDFYREPVGCCSPENFVVTITYGYERTFTLYPNKFRIPYCVVYFHDLVSDGLLDETNTSYDACAPFDSTFGIVLRGTCKECGQDFRSPLCLEYEPPQCCVCNDTIYPCLKCSCDRWYCNQHKHMDPCVYGLCVQCQKIVCSECGYLCHEGNCCHPVCDGCSTSVDCCNDDKAKLCFRCTDKKYSQRHLMCGTTLYDVDDV